MNLMYDYKYGEMVEIALDMRIYLLDAKKFLIYSFEYILDPLLRGSLKRRDLNFVGKYPFV